MVCTIEPAGDIVRSLVEEAEAAMRALPSVCGG
jgi:hypothetical protein